MFIPLLGPKVTSLKVISLNMHCGIDERVGIGTRDGLDLANHVKCQLG